VSRPRRSGLAKGAARRRLAVLAGFIFLAGLATASGEELDAMLSSVGLRAEMLAPDPREMSLWGGGARRLPLFDALLADPTRLDRYTRSFRIQGLEAAGSVEKLVAFAAWRAGLPVRRGLIPDADPLPGWKRAAGSSGALADSLLALQPTSAQWSAERMEKYRAACDRVPPQAAAPAALLLRAIREAESWRESALRDLGGNASSLPSRAVKALLDQDLLPDLELLRSLERDGDLVDLRRLAAGAEEIGRAVDAAIQMISSQDLSSAGAFSHRFETDLGDVILRGTGPDTLDSRGEGHAPGAEGGRGGRAVLLLLDLGGDDIYETGSGPPAGGISIWIDAAGNDIYRASAVEPGAFGAGIGGYGVLVDMGGDDSYSAGPVSLGAGLYGVGVLLDFSGRDIYRGGEFTQAAGSFGLGILADLEGRDDYRAVQMAQGYAGVAGAGLLADRSGNDLYEAADPSGHHPSPQAPEHSTSLAQGCASGRRADYLDGHSEAGGIGMLLDGGGDDTYRAGVFAQGCGYWYGVGLLADGSGDDSYGAVWYAQGAGAHFAIGFLLDESGSDRYSVARNMGQGAGHDFSVGGLVDVAGDDRYRSPNLALGAGNDNGTGIFWDSGGDDSYRSAGPLALGRASITAPPGGVRDLMKCVGVFADSGGGRDSYRGDGAEAAGDDSTWLQEKPTQEGAAGRAFGVGMDR